MRSPRVRLPSFPSAHAPSPTRPLTPPPPLPADGAGRATRGFATAFVVEGALEVDPSDILEEVLIAAIEAPPTPAPVRPAHPLGPRPAEVERPRPHSPPALPTNAAGPRSPTGAQRVAAVARRLGVPSNVLEQRLRGSRCAACAAALSYQRTYVERQRACAACAVELAPEARAMLDELARWL